jgi:hypothetical protein
VVKDIVDSVAWDKEISPDIKDILEASPEDIVDAYCQYGGDADPDMLLSLIKEGAKQFFLSGTDLMLVRDKETGKRRFVVLEVNSAPGFAYCTPEKDCWEYAYQRVVDLLLEHTPKEKLEGLVHFSEGKTPVEDVGFVRCLEKTLGRKIEVLTPEKLLSASIDEMGIMTYNSKEVTGGIRYLHDSPWDYLPARVKGTFINSIDIDLKGGRDKLVAENAFSRFACKVATPQSYQVDSWAEIKELFREKQIPLVVKKRHLNSGVGIYFLLDEEQDFSEELEVEDFPLVVQEMIPPVELPACPCFQEGVNVEGKTYAYDLRIVLGSFSSGFKPMMMYARRGRRPLDDFSKSQDAQVLDDIFKVNIAKKNEVGDFVFESERLILPTAKEWSQLNLSKEECLAAFAESVLAVAAVDRS